MGMAEFSCVVCDFSVWDVINSVRSRSILLCKLRFSQIEKSVMSM